MLYQVCFITRSEFNGCECSNDCLFESNSEENAQAFFDKCVNDFASDYDKEKATAGKGFSKQLWEYQLCATDEDCSEWDVPDIATYSYDDWVEDHQD